MKIGENDVKNFNESLGQDVTYDNIKIQKKAFLKKIKRGEGGGGSFKLTQIPPSLFTVKTTFTISVFDFKFSYIYFKYLSIQLLHLLLFVQQSYQQDLIISQSVNLKSFPSLSIMIYINIISKFFFIYM